MLPRSAPVVVGDTRVLASEGMVVLQSTKSREDRVVLTPGQAHVLASLIRPSTPVIAALLDEAIRHAREAHGAHRHTSPIEAGAE